MTDALLRFEVAVNSDAPHNLSRGVATPRDRLTQLRGTLAASRPSPRHDAAKALQVDAEEFSYVHLCQLPDIYRVHEAASVPPHESQGAYKFAAVHNDGSIALYDDEDGELTSHGSSDDPHVAAVARALRARGAGMRDRSLSR